MRILNNNDFKTFEQMCALSQKSLKKSMGVFLRNKYEKVIETKHYIVAEGDIPIALVAHMDTVFAKPAKDVFYDRQKNVIWSPEGLGADDRAGIFAIIQIIKKGLRPHIILTTDEEKGCVGASKLAEVECPFKDLRFVIELDRRGANDCVFYDCANQEFINYIEKFGFVEALGSFTDISAICPPWKIAGVNLSVGYRDEHSVSEILYVGHLLNTIDKVITILSQEEIPSFEYIESPYMNNWFKWIKPKTNSDNTHCVCCKKTFAPDELIPVLTTKGTIEYYCIDCAVDKVDWCNCCGEAFEVPSVGSEIHLCEDCWYDFKYTY